ncbi:hypothetical protein GCM10023094_00410 [Rhodococcus olei]|uniref:Thioredoxin family protein n=1 Tax=Rhodococcus olei TaxID=2161675 RepID=A0ABP8NTT2_9NOCA
MKVEILYVDECPNRREAGEHVLAALTSAGRVGADVDDRLPSTREEAAAVPFAGSPTILVDGVDAFPAERVTELACRVPDRVWTGGSADRRAAGRGVPPPPVSATS